MIKESRLRALWLLMVVVVGGLVAPSVHRVHHAESWRAWQLAKEQAAHNHEHDGAAFCNAVSATLPISLQDSPCVLCQGVFFWGTPSQEQHIPIQLFWTQAEQPQDVVSALSATPHFIRGPPHLV